MSNSNKAKSKKSFNNILRGNINVSVCTINQWAMDFPNNEKRIIKAIEDAKKKGGKIILLPELATTGYSCQDHFYENETYMLSMNIIRNICNDTDLTKDILLVLGAPVIHDGVKYNTMIFISNNEIILIRPKINLADDGNYREARWFTSWAKEGLENFQLKGFNKQNKTKIGIAIVNCNGVKVAAEVCEELWVPQSMNIPLYLNDTDIILNSSGSHFEMNKIQKRINLVNAATKRSGGAYVYSNMKGCDGERLYFDGGSFIGINGSIIGMQDRFSLIDVEILTCKINLDDITSYRLKGSSIQTQSSKVKKIDVIDISLDLKSNKGLNNQSDKINNQSDKINTNKIIDHSKNINQNLERSLFIKNGNKILHKKIEDISNKEIVEICEASACWLWDYLKRSGANGFMLPLSGGADSAVVSLLVKIMCNKVEIDWKSINSDIIEYSIVKRLKDFKNKNSEINSNYICSIILKSVYLPVKGRSFSESKPVTNSETYIRSEAIAKYIGSVWSSQEITDIYENAKKILEIIMQTEISKTKTNKESDKKIRYNKSSRGVKAIINNNSITSELEINNVIQKERFPQGLKTNGGINNPKLWSKYGLADENLQARLRMVVNYLLSLSLNESGFLLTLACSNADEVLIGYYTKYDASSGDLNPIGSMPKRFVNKTLEYYSLLWVSKEYADVLIATPTAELTTQNSSARPQTNEDEIGLTYDQIYYFGKLRSNGYGMITMFDYIVKNLNKKEIQDLVIPNYINKNENVKEKYIKQKLIIFFNKYKTNRHKTVILTPSVHLLPSPDDNRFDLRPFLYPEFTEQTSYIENQISGK